MNSANPSTLAATMRGGPFVRLSPADHFTGAPRKVRAAAVFYPVILKLIR